mmetsp:Transcript_8470/g.15353  ORF Transcript_8470/g.15353 Transcript_8470/m.15353 type:complete len:118 (-) Transcript_8470:388-741(-)
MKLTKCLAILNVPNPQTLFDATGCVLRFVVSEFRVHAVEESLGHFSGKGNIAQTVPSDGNVLAYHEEDKQWTLTWNIVERKCHNQRQEEGTQIKNCSNPSSFMKHFVYLFFRSHQEK